MRCIALIMLLAAISASAGAEETTTDDEAAEKAVAETPQGDGIESPKTMSGM